MTRCLALTRIQGAVCDSGGLSIYYKTLICFLLRQLDVDAQSSDHMRHNLRSATAAEQSRLATRSHRILGLQ
jgi:hypothetical protein